MNYTSKFEFVATQEISESMSKKFTKVNHQLLNTELVSVIEDKIKEMFSGHYPIGVRTYKTVEINTSIVEVCVESLNVDKFFMLQFKHKCNMTIQGLDRFKLDKKEKEAKLVVERKREEIDARIPEGKHIKFCSTFEDNVHNHVNVKLTSSMCNRKGVITHYDDAGDPHILVQYSSTVINKVSGWKSLDKPYTKELRPNLIMRY